MARISSPHWQETFQLAGDSDYSSLPLGIVAKPSVGFNEAFYKFAKNQKPLVATYPHSSGTSLMPRLRSWSLPVYQP